MNQENRLPQSVRESADRRNGSQKQSFPEEVVSQAKDRIQGAPTFASLAEAAQYADKHDPSSVFKNPQDKAEPYVVLPFEQYQMGLFAGYAFVIPDDALTEALEALNTDEIEEV